MDKRKMLDRVSEETMIFMRGKYALDEVGDGKEELRFCCSGKTILMIRILEDRFDFFLTFDKEEQEKFETVRGAFAKEIQNIYDSSKTDQNGKHLTIPVAELAMLEEVKKIMFIKKQPNRKPLPADNKIVSKCGHRCDLCIHFTGGTISDEFRDELRERLGRIYGIGAWGEDMMYCPGCSSKAEDDLCDQLKCAADKGCQTCLKCSDYPCEISPVTSSRIEPRSLSHEDITLGILPYVHNQYGN